MRFYYNATLTSMDGYKVRDNVVKDAIITDEGEGAYPYILYINGQYIGKSKTLQNAERLAKCNFGMHYKIEKKI